MAKKKMTVQNMVDLICDNSKLTQEQILLMDHDDFIETFEIVSNLIAAQRKVQLQEILMGAKLRSEG